MTASGGQGRRGSAAGACRAALRDLLIAVALAALPVASFYAVRRFAARPAPAPAITPATVVPAAPHTDPRPIPSAPPTPVKKNRWSARVVPPPSTQRRAAASDFGAPAPRTDDDEDPCPSIEHVSDPGRPQPASQTPRVAGVSYSFEPAEPSAFRRAVHRIPVLNALQRDRFKGGDRFTPARPVSSDPPAIPAGATPDGIAIVVADVNESGKVVRVRRRDGDERLAALAARAVRHWEFAPARLGDERVDSKMIVHFTFSSGSSD